MTYDDDKLEQDILKAFPPIKAPETFKNTLKQELLRMPKKRKKIKTWLYAASAVAAVFILTFTLWPTSPQSPANLPPLPPLTATGPITHGASAGPGVTVELSYKAGQLSALPAEALAYRSPAVPFSQDALAATAARLGITGDVREEPWQDQHVYTAGSLDTKLITIFPTGYYSYIRRLPDSWQGQTIPSQTELKSAAEKFLPSMGIDPAEAQIKGITQSNNGDYLSYVTFIPKGLSKQISFAPYAQIQVGPDGEVYGASWVWLTDSKTSQTYSLRSVEEAWTDIKNGNGVIEMDFQHIEAADTVIVGTGKINENFIGYVLTYDDDNNVVMQPVAAFSGTATLANGQEVPFTVYTQAVLPEHY